MKTPDPPDERTLDSSSAPQPDPSDATSPTLDSGETLPDSAASSPTTPGGASPRTIGPYRLVRKLGEGGMGQVWLAEQTAPLQRLVAIKLIRAGVSDNVLLERFESERQALARMNHPAIAKVFDAGATSEGTPFFVMEYVPGTPITLYCDQKRLSIRQRLELFLKVCEGVQHAHQKAILHRDLKPANILVNEIDGKPYPHIIDFGIAKAIGDRDPLATMFTRAGNFVGTPVYMSPEQANPDVQDVDTRSDVYSLAVILYELLTGALPFDPTQWRLELRQEQFRKLFEQDPPAPSLQFRKKTTTQSENATQTAKLRSTEPQQLFSDLKGDLDWITLKALERDRARRYGTPSEFAADLQRFLHHEPVVARPASASYRLQKYVRRHRLGVVIAAAALLLLVAFSIMQAVEIRRIREERDRTARERDRANRIAEFMTKMFKVSDPSEARGNSITAREVLDKASKDIDTGLAKDPDMQARMMDVMGTVYDNLGLYPPAESLTRRSLELLRQTVGPENIETLRLENNLGNILYDEGKYKEAEKFYRHAFDSLRAQLGPENLKTLQAMNDLANAIYGQGRYSESESMYRQALQISRRTLGPDHRETIAQMGNLSNNLGDEGKFAEAEALDRQVLEARRRTLGPDHPESIRALNDLGITQFFEGKYSEAEASYRQTLEDRRRVLGPEHPETLLAIYNLAGSVLKQNRLAEAEKLYRQALEAQVRTLGKDHPDSLHTMTDLSNTLSDEGQFAPAIAMAREALAILIRTQGPENPATLQTMTNLGWTLRQAGQLPEAEKLTRQAYDKQSQVLGPENPVTLSTLDSLASILRAQHRYADAEPLSRQVLDIRRRVLGPDHPDTAASAYNLACVQALQSHRDQAFQLLQQSIEHGLSPAALSGLAKDPDLASLRSDPRFSPLVDRARKLAAASTK